MRNWLAAVVLVATVADAAWGESKLKPADVPELQLRARVVKLGDRAPAADKKTSFNLAGVNATADGDGWSPWMAFGQPQIEATLQGYPAMYSPGWPLVLHLSVGGAIDPTQVEAELKFAGANEPIKLSAELFGPTLGVVVWRDADGHAQAATMAEYNHRYWKSLEGVAVPEAQRPKRFPIVDRFIGGDDDRRDWQEGIEQLRRAGYSAIMLPPSKPIRDLLLKAGGQRTAWAVYNPPDAYDVKTTPEVIKAWAEHEAKPYLDAGYARQDMALFAMADEPGWYYPQAYRSLTANPAALARFRAYLQEQKLTLAEVGAKNWDEVQPIGRSQAQDLPSRRLFYWTMRFFAHDSAQHYADCTRALEAAFYPGLPIFTNWNFFSGRFYVPGPVANNVDKQSADAAMGGHDWLEFGRLRGGTMLWTEDWFADNEAYQWSFYCAKFRSATAKSGVQFGGYVIPRTAGDRPDGIIQKDLAIVGSGGKAIEYFVFGPEYNFPGNCYSERAAVLPKMAAAHRMIGSAEDVLWPGRPRQAQVAILAPRSAEVWDAKRIAVPNQIQDATNNHPNRDTVDYMAEVFDLYLALQHANIPADFLDEDDLSPQGLKAYRVVYVTEPNIPVEGQQGLADWVRAGGTLVMVSGAGQGDRYDEPCDVLGQLTTAKSEPRERLLVQNVKALKVVGQGAGQAGDFTAFGVQSKLAVSEATVIAKWNDGSPAISETKVGEGRVIQFAWFPGISYWASSEQNKNEFPGKFSSSVRDWIVWPVQQANVHPPVLLDHPLVEGLLLESDAGAAVTLLNWTNDEVLDLHVDVNLDKPVKRVESVLRGPLEFKQASGHVTFMATLKAADIITLRP